MLPTDRCNAFEDIAKPLGSEEAHKLNQGSMLLQKSLGFIDLGHHIFSSGLNAYLQAMLQLN